MGTESSVPRRPASKRLVRRGGGEAAARRWVPPGGCCGPRLRAILGTDSETGRNHTIEGARSVDIPEVVA
jgi:hypothetical protein